MSGEWQYVEVRDADGNLGEKINNSQEHMKNRGFRLVDVEYRTCGVGNDHGMRFISSGLLAYFRDLAEPATGEPGEGT